MNVVFAAESVDPASSGPCDNSRGRVRLLLDPGGAMATRFNARWAPRAFLIDARGRIAWVEPGTTPDPKGPELALAAWRRLGLQASHLHSVPLPFAAETRP